jgi:hypothetical protein
MLKKAPLSILIVMLVLLVPVAYAIPSGAGVTPGTSETRTAPAAGSHGAYGGNITQLDLDANTQTLVWQGYFGEVSGDIVLEDASGDRLYNWSVGSTSGEVYASLSDAVTWGTIAAENDCTTDESITGTGADRVNNTFTASSNTEFQVGGTTITVNTACALNTFVNSASSSDFEEIMLDDGSNIVYATILEDNLVGFDGSTHDFQMLVPEDNDGTTTTYYFYVELS